MTPPAPLRLALDGDALTSNWRYLAARSGGAACGAAIKADGYGLGARDVLQRLAAIGCRDFFVATWAEADALGRLPADVAVSVLHGVRDEDMAAARASPARPVLSTATQVKRWRDGGGGTCDVMVDTGMNRLGLTADEARSGLIDGLAIETLMSHLACADEPRHPLNGVQLDRFNAVRVAVPARRYSLANSAGILLGDEYAFNLTRPGLALYGGVPVRGDPSQRGGLRAVATPQAQVLQLRAVEAGETVGYGATWTAPAPVQVAVLNVGYGDGYLRSLGDRASAQVAGLRFPIIGRISMDLIAVDVTGGNVCEGDWLDLDFDLPRLADDSALSQYELLTSLGRRYDRSWH